MNKKDDTIKELQQRIKELEAEVERQKMLNLCRPVYVEPVKQRTSQTCSNCSGTGYVQVFYPYDNNTGGSQQVCPVCNGSGVIHWNREFTTNYKIVSGQQVTN